MHDIVGASLSKYVTCRHCSYDKDMHAWACRRARETVAILFLTNGNTLLENKCQRASETRLHELSVTGLCYHCVSKRCLCSGGACIGISASAQVRLLSELSHTLGTYCELIATAGLASLWIFLAVHTNRMSCLYTYMLYLICNLSSVGVGTREVCRSGNETTIECARVE